MTFSDFVKILKPIIGGSRSNADFVRDLFVTMLGINNSNLIEDASTEIFKNYFSGRNTISSISKKIAPFIDPENFVKYLDDFGDAVSQKLSEVFSSKISGINSQNASYKIAYYFYEIINTAAASKRKSPSKKDEPLNLPDEQNSYAFPYDENDIVLLDDFITDYDEIMINLIGDSYASFLINMNLPNKIQNLYNTKWKDKANGFVDPTLKSYVYRLLGVLDELSNNFISSNSNTTFIKEQRTIIRNLYIKLHPKIYDKSFPYDILIDDWNDNEF